MRSAKGLRPTAGSSRGTASSRSAASGSRRSIRSSTSSPRPRRAGRSGSSSSAGLVFALALHDTLTPGSLTGGNIIAGTGTIAPDGAVGPIGGIQQKIAGARQADAELFLVPADNCEEALDAEPGDMRLTRVETFDDALASIRAFADDPDADLPACEKEK